MASMASTLAASSLSTKLHKPSLLNSSFHDAPLARVQYLKAASFNGHNLSVSMFASTNAYNLSNFKFEPIKKSIVSRKMTHRYITDMITYADTDVVIVNAYSAGLSCAYELSKNPDVQVAIIEQSLSPRGDAWLCGQLFSSMKRRR